MYIGERKVSVFVKVRHVLDLYFDFPTKHETHISLSREGILLQETSTTNRNHASETIFYVNT